MGANPISLSDSTGLVPGPSPEARDRSCAQLAFVRNYLVMRKWKMSDKYFHCKANCEAARCGKYGYDEACSLSDEREEYGQRKNPPDPIIDSLKDQEANRHGRWNAVIQPA